MNTLINLIAAGAVATVVFYGVRWLGYIWVVGAQVHERSD